MSVAAFDAEDVRARGVVARAKADARARRAHKARPQQHGGSSGHCGRRKKKGLDTRLMRAHCGAARRGHRPVFTIHL